MATRQDQVASTSLQGANPCPFCGREFIRLGNHLHKCKERGERDYSAYLSKKTLESQEI